MGDQAALTSRKASAISAAHQRSSRLTELQRTRVWWPDDSMKEYEACRHESNSRRSRARDVKCDTTTLTRSPE
eukprot:4434975-Pyramimonas_sp.AAC.1